VKIFQNVCVKRPDGSLWAVKNRVVQAGNPVKSGKLVIEKNGELRAGI